MHNLPIWKILRTFLLFYFNMHLIHFNVVIFVWIGIFIIKNIELYLYAVLFCAVYCKICVFTISEPSSTPIKTSVRPRQLKQCCLGLLATPSLSNDRGYITMLWSQVIWANTNQSLRYYMWMPHIHRCIKTTSIYLYPCDTKLVQFAK